MTKKQLLKKIEKIDDDALVTIVTREYDARNDLTWGPDCEQDSGIKVRTESGQVEIVLTEVSEFNS